MDKMAISDTGVEIEFPSDCEFICVVANKKSRKLEAGGNSSDEHRVTFPLIALGGEIATLPDGIRQYVAEKAIRYIADKAGIEMRVEKKSENVEEPKWTT